MRDKLFWSLIVGGMCVLLTVVFMVLIVGIYI